MDRKMSMSPELTDALAKAKHWHETATPEEKEAMWKVQREGWAKSEVDMTDGCGTTYSPARTTPDLPERGGWRDMVQSLVASIECAAGCDDHAWPDTKSSEVFSWAGSAVGVDYDKAVHMLARSPAPAGELEEMPEGWRVYTVDASIEGRWRVMLKGPERDYPAEDDWPAFRGPAYVCKVGHDLASGIAACVAAIANTHPGATTEGVEK